jgi:hypothetical protein
MIMAALAAITAGVVSWKHFFLHFPELSYATDYAAHERYFRKTR